eukprot:COSAG02_NODE_6311_length_3662_cov_3.062026_4_plen_230_part_00
MLRRRLSQAHRTHGSATVGNTAIAVSRIDHNSQAMSNEILVQVGLVVFCLCLVIIVGFRPMMLTRKYTTLRLRADVQSTSNLGLVQERCLSTISAAEVGEVSVTRWHPRSYSRPWRGRGGRRKGGEGCKVKLVPIASQQVLPLKKGIQPRVLLSESYNKTSAGQSFCQIETRSEQESNAKKSDNTVACCFDGRRKDALPSTTLSSSCAVVLQTDQLTSSILTLSPASLH